MLIVIGTNHKYSPIELREKLFFSKKKLRYAINFLSGTKTIREAVILSTCNRVEIYASAQEEEKAIVEIEDFISRYHEIDIRGVYPYLYRYKDINAYRHLMYVVAGLDSLILGETQILGQVKSSFLETETAGFVDKFLKRVFYSAFDVTKKVHAETKVSEGRISVGRVAIDFIKERIGTLKDKNVLIIGVGKITELVLEYLKKEKTKVVFVSNRTFERAKELSYKIGAQAVRFDKLKEFINKTDVVISATASPHFIIKKEILDKTVNHNLLIIDLALPRDVDPQVKEIDNVDLYCLEDIDIIIKKNWEKRNQEALKAKAIIDIEVNKLWDGLTRLEREPALWL